MRGTLRARAVNWVFEKVLPPREKELRPVLVDMTLADIFAKYLEARWRADNLEGLENCVVAKATLEIEGPTGEVFWVFFGVIVFRDHELPDRAIAMVAASEPMIEKAKADYQRMLEETLGVPPAVH